MNRLNRFTALILVRAIRQVARNNQRTLAGFDPNQPRDERGQWAGVPSGILEAIVQADGGFTYQPATGEQPKTGFALSLHKDRERIVPLKDISLMTLVQYAKDNIDLLSNPNNYFGAWHNPADNKVYFDVSTVVNSSQEAERLGREAHQLAYFDLEQGKSVDITEARNQAAHLSSYRAKSRPTFPRRPDRIAAEAHRARAESRGDRTGPTDLLSLALHPETKIHAVADAHVGKFAVALRYAFAAARRVLKRNPRDVKGAIVALENALKATLPKMLVKVVRQGGVIGAELLRKQFKTAGGAGSGNFGHAGRPGEVGGSGPGGGLNLDKNGFASDGTPGPAIARRGGALWEYRASGHVDLNAELRKHGEPVTRDFIKHVKQLDEAMKPLAKATTLYREDSRLAGMAYGETVTDRGYMSTTKKSGAAVWGDSESVVRIDVPAGTKTIRLGDFYAKDPEQEVILARGTSLKAVGSKHFEVVTKRALAKDLDFKFDVTNQDAVDWADKHAAELIDGISETSREAINNAIADALETGDLEDALDEIFAAVGDKDRAERIARHETMMAASEGQRQAWAQAVDEGELTGDERRVWITVGDDKVCPICEGLDGQEADLDGEYEGGYNGPPAHPLCRCTEGIVSSRELGGEGSGNFGHAGRPGEVGGSAPSDHHGPSGWPITDDIPREFGTNYPSVVEKVGEEWSKTLSEAELTWIRHYTDLHNVGPKSYKNLNANLRKDPNNLPEEVKLIQSAIEKGPTPPPPELVWRAVDKFGAEQFLHLNEGATVQMNGFQSTTIKPLFATQWGEFVMEIKPAKGAYVKPISHHPDQYEYLLPHGYEYKLRGHARVRFSDKEVTVFQLEMLPKS